jgi:outer membrane protein assembly factor BamB
MFKRLPFDYVLCLVAAIVAIAVTAAPALAQFPVAAWPMASQNAHRSNEALASGPLAQPTAQWGVHEGGNIIVGKTAVFHTDSRRGLTAINFNGRERWNMATWNGRPPVLGPNGTPYVGGDPNWSTVGLYAIDPEVAPNPDGTLANEAIKWTIPYAVIGDVLRLAVDRDGCIFASGYKIQDNGASFQFLWGGRRVTVWGSAQAPAIHTPSPYTSDDVIFITDAHRLYAFKSGDGSALWTRTFKNSEIEVDPVAGNDGTVYVTTSPDYILSAINPRTGATKWQVALASKTKPWYVCGSTPAIDNHAGVLYIAGLDSCFALNKDTGALIFKWSRTERLYIDRPVIGLDGILYWGGANSVLYAIEPSTGVTLWSVDGGSPVIGLDGTLYTGTQAGLLVAYR